MIEEESGSELERAPDWLQAIDALNAELGDEFDLTELQVDDQLRVTTGSTVYTFRIVDPKMRDVTVEADRENRPSGRARIMGCVFGMGSSIKPDHLFCGGNLEFTHKEGKRTHTTTAIRKVEWMRVEREGISNIEQGTEE